MTKTADHTHWGCKYLYAYTYIPIQGSDPPGGGGCHAVSQFFLIEVTNFTVLLWNPYLIIINWLTAPHTFFSL